jgi:hypothetical protein
VGGEQSAAHHSTCVCAQMTPEMVEMAAGMMEKMTPEDMQRMMAMAGQAGAGAGEAVRHQGCVAGGEGVALRLGHSCTPSLGQGCCGEGLRQPVEHAAGGDAAV